MAWGWIWAGMHRYKFNLAPVRTKNRSEARAVCLPNLIAVGAQKPNVFGIWMVEWVWILNGVWFSYGLDKMAAILFRFQMVWFWNGRDHNYSYMWVAFGLRVSYFQFHLHFCPIRPHLLSQLTFKVNKFKFIHAIKSHLKYLSNHSKNL